MDKKLMESIKDFKNLLKEDTLRVPDFNTEEEMQEFLDDSPTGTKFDIDIINPETGEKVHDSTED